MHLDYDMDDVWNSKDLIPEYVRQTKRTTILIRALNIQPRTKSDSQGLTEDLLITFKNF